MMWLVAGCEVELDATSGVIQTPGYGVNHYPNLVTCSWKIQAVHHRSLKLIFPGDKGFVLETSKDLLQVFKVNQEYLVKWF